MAVKRILFTFYPLFVHYNHGVALLSALCKGRGIETSLYMLDQVERFSDYVQQNRFDYVSFSCVTVHDYKRALPFMHEAKRSGCIVLLGGVYVKRGLPLDAPADFICYGEGETLPDFILDGDDRLFKEALVTPDLDALPLPDYELFSGITFDKKFPYSLEKEIKMLPYHSARGCYAQCSFCEIQGQRGGVRVRHKAKDDLALITEKYSPDLIYLCDELAPYYDAAWRASWGNFTYPFTCLIRADISEERLRWLCDHGMVGCGFGVESGDERYRNEVLRKGLLDSDIYRTVELLNKLGVYYAPYFITNTPGETFAIKAKTYKMAETLGGFSAIAEYENLFERREL